MPAKRTLSTPLLPLTLLSVLLALGTLSAAAAATTREVALHGPNGDGGGECDTADAPATTAVVAADSKAAKPPKKAPPATRIKPIVPVRSGGDDGVHAPRWHSFLPGMFR